MLPSFSLQGRRALVIGASGGLGLHFARLLAEAGAEVVLAARRLDALQRIVDLWPVPGQRVRAVSLDVNVASILGERPGGWVAPYCASKAGVVHLTKALALEWARYGIRVNALEPGYVETDLNRDFLASEGGQKLMARVPQRRFGKPADLDGALLLLASHAGSLITGAALAVDGGHLVSGL